MNKPIISDLFQMFITFLTTAGIKIILALILLVVGLKLIKLIIKFMSKSRAFSKLDGGVQSFCKSFIGIGLKVILFVTIASILGIPMTSMITVLGSAGVAVGLALQGSLSNIAGGLILLLFKPFTVGDYITSGDANGTVNEIGIFYTKLTTLDNRRIIVPNSSISNQTITNVSSAQTRRVDLEFCVGYEADINRVKEILLDIAKNEPLIFDEPAPFARLNKHGDSSLAFVFRVWCKAEDYWEVYYNMQENVKNEFDKAGISIPFPQLDVHMNN